MLRLTPYLLAVVMLTGCSGGGTLLDTLDYPQTEPKLQDIAGRYTPDAETQKYIQERGHYPERDISIQLSSDGTFTCTNIPDWWMTSSGEPSGRFVTKTGTWKPVKEQNQWWAVGLDFLSLKHFAVENTIINLVGAKPPFTLRIIIGDPDSGHAMDFTKHE